MKKIKVAEIITRLDWGGSPDIYRILAERLNPEIFEVILIIGDTNYPTQKTKEFLSRFRTRVIKAPFLQRDISPIKDMTALLELMRIFIKERFDIVHTHTAKAGALGRIAAKICGVKAIIHTPHGHNFYGYFGKGASAGIIKIETFLSGITDAIVALTKLEKSDYVRLKVADEDKVVMIPQGLELGKYAYDWKEKKQLRKELNIKPDDNVVGMVGRLEHVKGPDILIESATAVIKKIPNTKFIIAGEGGCRKALEERSRKPDLNGRIIFAGWREDIPALLSTMDIAVLPSRNEAVGMALLEAQAEGIPVIAAKVGGVPEVVIDNVTGVLVEPENPAGLSNAIIRLLSDKKKMNEMGRAGKEWVCDRFRAEEMVGRTEDLYTQILHKKGFFIGERR